MSPRLLPGHAVRSLSVLRGLTLLFEKRDHRSCFLSEVLDVEESFLCMFNPSSGCFCLLLVVGKFKWLTLCCSQECHCCFSSWLQRLWERTRRCIGVTLCFIIWKLDYSEILGRVQAFTAWDHLDKTCTWLQWYLTHPTQYQFFFVYVCVFP